MTELLICLCAWLGAGTPAHPRGGLCLPGVWSGPSAPFPGDLPLPDLERDARVARRRADDARRAGRALDRLLGVGDAEVIHGAIWGEFSRRYPSCPVDAAGDPWEGTAYPARALDNRNYPMPPETHR